MVECRVCKSENPNDKRFCRDCGTPLTLTCPTCHAAIEPGHAFCGDCGTALGADTGPGPQDRVATGQAVGAELGSGTPVAERRVCSVLFVDLVGFTPFSESRDPEEVRELLSTYFDRAKTVIGRYGGVVEKFIGDAVMAVWGTPVATEGDAERAVRAALDVVAAVAQLGRRGRGQGPGRSCRGRDRGGSRHRGARGRGRGRRRRRTPRRACSRPPLQARCGSMLPPTAWPGRPSGSPTPATTS